MTEERKGLRERALAEFTEYFVANYPGPETIIHDPRWHAPKIFKAAEAALAADRLDYETEIALLRGRLRTIGLAREFGVSNQEVAARLRELESMQDQARQYIQHAKEREHLINELRLAADRREGEQAHGRLLEMARSFAAMTLSPDEDVLMVHPRGSRLHADCGGD